MWKNRLGGRNRATNCREDIGAIRRDDGSMDQSGRGFRRESECSGETFRSHRYWASLGANGYNGWERCPGWVPDFQLYEWGHSSPTKKYTVGQMWGCLFGKHSEFGFGYIEFGVWKYEEEDHRLLHKHTHTHSLCLFPSLCLSALFLL